ncbi:MAG: hypothetical protein GF416_04095 [Candidatus Altiarchaeales archaeon]|nr:hypothetical protein [Candidatus Altiarchaeales archaeon]MBD3416301.1 hypothetical protein [Candidatus Altiarchaeales archaeon]
MNEKNATAMLALAALLLMLQSAAAQSCGANIPTMTSIQSSLKIVGSAAGVFMIVYLGIKWMTANGPQDRESARRGVIYVVIGLIILRTALELIEYLLC